MNGEFRKKASKRTQESSTWVYVPSCFTSADSAWLSSSRAATAASTCAFAVSTNVDVAGLCTTAARSNNTTKEFHCPASAAVRKKVLANLFLKHSDWEQRKVSHQEFLGFGVKQPRRFAETCHSKETAPPSFWKRTSQWLVVPFFQSLSHTLKQSDHMVQRRIF